ncbi:hypothetical protein ADUPG1_000678, partial [Aduncisulcus paluster]
GDISVCSGGGAKILQIQQRGGSIRNLSAKEIQERKFRTLEDVIKRREKGRDLEEEEKKRRKERLIAMKIEKEKLAAKEREEKDRTIAERYFSSSGSTMVTSNSGKESTYNPMSRSSRHLLQHPDSSKVKKSQQLQYTSSNSAPDLAESGVDRAALVISPGADITTSHDNLITIHTTRSPIFHSKQPYASHREGAEGAEGGELSQIGIGKKKGGSKNRNRKNNKTRGKSRKKSAPSSSSRRLSSDSSGEDWSVHTHEGKGRRQAHSTDTRADGSTDLYVDDSCGENSQDYSSYSDEDEESVTPSVLTDPQYEQYDTAKSLMEGQGQDHQDHQDHQGHQGKGQTKNRRKQKMKIVISTKKHKSRHNRDYDALIFPSPNNSGDLLTPAIDDDLEIDEIRGEQIPTHKSIKTQQQQTILDHSLVLHPSSSSSSSSSSFSSLRNGGTTFAKVSKRKGGLDGDMKKLSPEILSIHDPHSASSCELFNSLLSPTIFSDEVLLSATSFPIGYSLPRIIFPYKSSDNDDSIYDSPQESQQQSHQTQTIPSSSSSSSSSASSSSSSLPVPSNGFSYPSPFPLDPSLPPGFISLITKVMYWNRIEKESNNSFGGSHSKTVKKKGGKKKKKGRPKLKRPKKIVKKKK